ncbi:MAG: DUF308 domain-containing protein [Fretibacterium sp.]|uniref:HdeD family acid-resistance protein n=1 Tax=Fretibacterium sp. OH1220_COT-178 TaxID=2491047 RepID=UPI0013150D23|nr:DUF308 domain-containing protein [Fretibacterium sp. OH1220_COT-178]MDO4787253.1 DUF308 domain-containing protein [Fretibacterium sp.]
MKTMRWTLYFTGGLLVVLGLWAMTYPVEALMSLAFFLGIGFVVAGLNHLVPCFSLRGDPMCPRWMMLQGLLDLVIGVVMLTRIGLTAFMIPMLVAAWLCFTGLVRVATSFRLRSLGLRRWWWMLLNGLLLVLCAFAMAASPFVGGVSVALMMGSTLVVSGVLILIEARRTFM